jgi:hypothetical protein
MIDLILIDELIVKELCQLILSYATLAESSNLRPSKNAGNVTFETPENWQKRRKRYKSKKIQKNLQCGITKNTNIKNIESALLLKL